MFARVISSNTTSPRALSTGTASRSLPFTSIAIPTTACPSWSGNCSSPSSWRAFGLKKVSVTSVSALRPLICVSMRTARSATGASVGPVMTRRGASIAGTGCATA